MDPIKIDVLGSHFSLSPSGKEDLAHYYATEFYKERPEYLVEPEGEEKRWVEQGFADMLALLGDAKGRWLADFGAGKGHFARVAQEAGWKVLGVDASGEACDTMADKGVTSTPQMAEEFKWPHKLDAVTMFQLLEHVEDPAVVLERARGALVDGGLLLVSVPRDRSFMQSACRDFFDTGEWWRVEVHEEYFTAPTLCSLLECSGFEVLEETTTFPMELFVMLGMDYTKDGQAERGVGNTGAICHGMRRRMDLKVSAEWRREFYRRLAKVGIGRHIIMLARKA